MDVATVRDLQNTQTFNGVLAGNKWTPRSATNDFDIPFKLFIPIFCYGISLTQGLPFLTRPFSS